VVDTTTLLTKFPFKIKCAVSVEGEVTVVPETLLDAIETPYTVGVEPSQRRIKSSIQIQSAELVVVVEIVSPVARLTDFVRIREENPLKPVVPPAVAGRAQNTGMVSSMELKGLVPIVFEVIFVEALYQVGAKTPIPLKDSPVRPLANHATGDCLNDAEFT